MSTTSLKLSEALKTRTAHAAQELGITPHAFMVSAIEQATTQAELRHQFLEQAKDARQQVLNSGLAYPADAVHAYLQARSAKPDDGTGKTIAKRPKAQAWRA